MPVDPKGGCLTYWRDFGAGPRQALLFHCSLAHSGAFAGLAARLGDLLTMRAFDLPGHGGSAPWDHSRPLQRTTVDVARDFLTRPTDLIGHSFGATAALRLACEHPELVRSLVLIEPVFFAVAYADHPESKAPHLRQMAEIEAAVEAGDREAATRMFLRVWGDGRPWTELPEALRTTMMTQIDLVTAAHEEIGLDSPGLLSSGLLERLEVPTLLIEGGQSPDHIARICEGLNRRLRNSQRAVVEGAGHMLPITHARQVADRIRPFFEATA